MPATKRPPTRRRPSRTPPRPSTKLVQKRIGLLFAVFLLLLGLAALRATWIGTVKSDSLAQRALSQQVEELTIPARRGTIVDRNGVELAVSEDSITVFAHPFLIDDPAKVAARLAPLIGRDEGELLEKLSDRDSGFVYLRRRMDASRGHKVEELGIEGVDTVLEPKRTYPQGHLASQVLGFVGTENVGLSGLEYAREDQLGGTDGERKLVKDALGEPVSMVEVERAEPGEDLRLTIDAAIQERAEAVLSEVGQTYTPQGATAVVLDPRSGAILALANWPRVDANRPGDAPAYARKNRAIQDTYEPGSTFKAFTVAGAMEEKLIEPGTMFAVPPTIQVADRTVGEAHDGGGGSFSVADILQRSSNVGSVMIGLKLGAERFDKWVRRFGFGKPAGADLPGEEGGIVLRPERYSGSSMGNMPIGQGIAVTPMQMAAAYTAIANKGLMRRPYIVAGDRPAPRRVLSRRTAERVSKMLEGVLAAGGTAQEAQVEGYTLAGKTGTAEKAIDGGYSKTDFVASFIGYAPAKDPRLLVAVMVDTPRGDIYGGTVAAPAFERIVEFALPYLKIPPR
ncbi:MAG TPA: penicillin-binding protein 2 [Thermoleophilaceae bacterium]|nr:penicillin-binding protein 2 [Thermoleophilaceae bacterium]